MSRASSKFPHATVKNNTRNLRRWYDLANANKTSKIAGISLCVMLAIWIVILGAALIHEAKKDKRIYMMEQTISRLTHEVDNCRINRFLPKS